MRKFHEISGITIWKDPGFCWNIQYSDHSGADVNLEAETPEETLALLTNLLTGDEDSGRLIS